jgi:MFS family permease
VIGNPLLRSRDGLLYLIAQLMDAIGGGIALVALPWLVLDVGGSRTLAGAAYLIGTLPYVLLGITAGDLGDRLPRRRIMVLATAGQAAAAAALPVTVALGRPSDRLPLALIFAAGLGVTAGRVFVDAAAFGAIARLVGTAHFVEGQAALSVVWSLGFLVGPAVGGALIGWVGPVQAFWVQTIGFLLAVGMFLLIRTDLGPDPHHAPAGKRQSGLAMVAGNPVLRRLTGVGMAWNFAVNLFYALIVVYTRLVLHAGGPAAGRLLAVGGVAGLAGGSAAPVIRRRLGASKGLRLAVALNAVGAVGMALAGSLGQATVAFAVLEGTAILFITMLIGERQVIAGPAAQSRVGITGRMSALLAASAGALVASALVAVISVDAIYTIAAAATVLVALASSHLLRVDLA